MSNKINQTTRSPIGLFRQDITDPEQLAATTIARDHLVNDLLEKLESRGNKKSGLNHLFIGPRGIGKTHLLSLIAQGLDANKKLKKLYTLVRFPEESNRILSFADLLLGILDRLADIEEGKSKKELRDLFNELETKEDDEEIIDYIVPRLKHWYKQSGKSLVIMLENLDVLFTQQIKSKKDIHRIRSLLMDNSHILLIGTAPTFFPALNDVKHPLYDFFDIQVIEELSKEQTLALIKSHIEWEQRDDLIQQFEELKPRLLAMHTLTGGNPRLIMMLYELITQDNLDDIITRFHQLLDKITPFYQDRIKELSPQERALLETIALMRSQKRTPVNIAKKFRKSRKQTSVLLKRMTKAGYLTVSSNPDDGRSRLYRIKEGFFDIWLAMNESRANRKYMPFLVNFLSLWYTNQQDREKKRQQLSKKLRKIEQQGRNNALNLLDYLSETSSDLTEKQQAKLELALEQKKLGKSQKAIQLLDEVNALMPKKENNGLMTWMHDKATQWCNSGQGIDDITRMENIIEYWQVQRSGELEKASQLYHELKLDFSSHGLHQLHIALLEEKLHSARKNKDRKFEGILLNIISQVYIADGKLETALDYLNQSLIIRQEVGDKQGEGTTLNNISQIYHIRGDYETALDYLNQSLIIRQEVSDKQGEGRTLNNISQIYHALGDYETALDYLNQSLVINHELGDKSGEATTLNNISQIYHARGDYEAALDYINQSLTISQKTDNKSGEGKALNNMATIYHACGNYEASLDYLNQSLAISQDIGDKSEEGTTLNNISQVYDARGDYKTALDYLNQSLIISQEIGDKLGEGITLNNISSIYHTRGDDETALDYLNQSLAISREIGDIAGSCMTLFNLGHIHWQNKERKKAMEKWLAVYNTAKEINLAQALDALDGLAEEVGLEGGLKAWEKLANEGSSDSSN